MCLTSLARVSCQSIKGARVSKVQLQSDYCSDSVKCCQDLLLGIVLNLKLICDWLNLGKQVLYAWFDPKRD